MLLQRITPGLPFPDASALWLSFRRVDKTPGSITAGYIKQNTDNSYEQYIRSLNLFFGGLRLEDIHLGHIREYQRARLYGDDPFIRRRRPHEAPAPCPAGPKKVNQELQVLVRILKRAGCWNDELEETYEPLQVDDTDIPRSLTPQEQQRWLDTCRLSERWTIIYCYSIIAFQTTFSTNEMRGLRLGDINLHQGVVTVPVKSAKKRRRARTVPMNTAEIRWAFEWLIDRARDCGSVGPQHYLLPFRERGRRRELEGFNPDRPMTESGIKRLWQEVRDASELRWFRTYDTRHTAITRMAEAGIPTTVIEEYAGHVSDRMRRHYTHISEVAKRAWGVWAFSQHPAIGGAMPPTPPMLTAQPAGRWVPPRSMG